MALEEFWETVAIIQVFIHALHTHFITVYKHLRSTAQSMCIMQIKRDLCRPMYSDHLVDCYFKLRSRVYLLLQSYRKTFLNVCCLLLCSYCSGQIKVCHDLHICWAGQRIHSHLKCPWHAKSFSI